MVFVWNDARGRRSRYGTDDRPGRRDAPPGAPDGADAHPQDRGPGLPRTGAARSRWPSCATRWRRTSGLVPRATQKVTAVAGMRRPALLGARPRLRPRRPPRRGHPRLPHPASFDELCARLAERHLDRDRPLWSMTLVHGLRDGHQAVVVRAAPRGQRRPRRAEHVPGRDHGPARRGRPGVPRRPGSPSLVRATCAARPGASCGGLVAGLPRLVRRRPRRAPRQPRVHRLGPGARRAGRRADQLQRPRGPGAGVRQRRARAGRAQGGRPRHRRHHQRGAARRDRGRDARRARGPRRPRRRPRGRRLRRRRRHPVDPAVGQRDRPRHRLPAHPGRRPARAAARHRAKLPARRRPAPPPRVRAHRPGSSPTSRG